MWMVDHAGDFSRNGSVIHTGNRPTVVEGPSLCYREKFFLSIFAGARVTGILSDYSHSSDHACIS